LSTTVIRIESYLLFKGKKYDLWSVTPAHLIVRSSAANQETTSA